MAQALAVAMQGVLEYEPRVVLQLLDFLYRYVSETLQDADVRVVAAYCALAGTVVYLGNACILLFARMQAYSERAIKSRSEIMPEDVMLAIQSREAFCFVQPPPQDVSANQQVVVVSRV